MSVVFLIVVLISLCCLIVVLIMVWVFSFCRFFVSSVWCVVSVLCSVIEGKVMLV